MTLHDRASRPACHLTAAVMVLGATSCSWTMASRGVLPQPERSRALVDTFDRVLIAGFVAGQVRDRGHDLDINVETARLLRMALRSKGALDVIESEPLVLRRASQEDTSSDDGVFADVAFWKRLGEEYREPLVLTGTVTLRPIGSQFEERTTGRGTVRVWCPGYSLGLRLVFISGRTGDVLESVTLGPLSMERRLPVYLHSACTFN